MWFSVWDAFPNPLPFPGSTVVNFCDINDGTSSGDETCPVTVTGTRPYDFDVFNSGAAEDFILILSVSP